MEGYKHIQALPNSPLTPLTPLNENTQFNFNLGGDGSLDHHIENLRLEFRKEKQQKHRQVEEISSGKALKARGGCELLNKRGAQKAQQQYHPKQGAAIQIKITEDKTVHQSYVTTPTHARPPLRPVNRNIMPEVQHKYGYQHQQQEQQQKNRCQQHIGKVRYLRPASPVAIKPLSPRMECVLKQKNLMGFYDLFQREELDIFAFHLLQPNDLRCMGIINDSHIAMIMKAKEFARKHFN
uniref:SAM domain-containing protein n=1 Tax=Glossina morsitans morsitans TaxID=37546 RepID=A0A1B0FA15_GLOMM